MKKIALVLTLLLVIGMTGAFAEVGLSGEFMFGATKVGTPDLATKAHKAEINFKATVDDFTTVAVELDAEGADWTNNDISLDDFRVTSDITGALGVDAVSLSLTAGYFDTYYNNWNYVSRSGEEYYYSGLAGAYLWTRGPRATFAAAFDLGFGDYSVKYWQPVDGSAVSVAFSGNPVDGANFLIGYYAPTTTFVGSLWIDGGYSFEAGPASVTIPVSLVVDLSATTENLGWSSGVAADIDVFHVAVGLGGAGANMFKDINVEVSTSAVENADIYVIGDLDASTAGVFQSVDLGAKYSFGAFGLCAGYVIAADAATSTAIWSDSNSMTGSGAYVYADLDF